MKIKAKCTLCGAEYWKTNGKSKYCSDACKKAGRKATGRVNIRTTTVTALVKCEGVKSIAANV